MSEFTSEEIGFMDEDQNNALINRKLIDHCFLTWTIHNFRKIPQISETVIVSPAFHINSESWNIGFFPIFMFRDEKIIKFSLSRNEVREQFRTVVTLRFGIKGCRTVWFEEKRSIEFPVGGEDITVCDILKYFDGEDDLKGNTLTIQCEMYIAYSNDKSLSESHALQLFGFSLDILSQYENPQNSDVIIRGKNMQDIFVHKAILASRSPVFAKILKKKCSSIDIPENDSDHIHNILSYIYTGIADSLILSNMRIGFYECAKQYELTGLVQVLTPSEVCVSSTIKEQNIEFTWKIDKFSGYYTERNCCVTSPPFHAGLKDSPLWYLDIYPHGSHRALNSIGIFVRNLQLKSFSGINLSVSILDEFNQEHCQKCTNKPLYPYDVHGFPDFTTRKELSEKGLLRDDTLILRCRIAFDVVLHYDKAHLALTSSFLKHSCIEQLSADFEKLLLEENFSDLTLVADKNTFHVHKVILSARSPRFAELIKASGKESDAISVIDVSPEVLEAMIFYAYTGKLKQYSNRLITELYSGAKAYSMLSLVDSCIKALNSLDSSCIWDVILLAYRGIDKRLLEKCVVYLQKNNEKILESKEWRFFGRNYPNLSSELEMWVKNSSNKEIKLRKRTLAETFL